MKQLKRSIKGRVRFNQRLSRHTTFRIGGKAEVWVEPENLEDLRNTLKFFRKSGKRIYIIGGGSNLLVNNGTLRGVVISLSSPAFRNISAGGRYLRVGAGARLNSVLKTCAEKRLSGLEFLSGIPGTAGGAVAMNASGIGRFVEKIIAMDRSGRIKTLNKKDLKFDYRASSLNSYIILDAEFKLRKAKKAYIKKQIKMHIDGKRKTQDLRAPSAGCVFKNPCNGLVSAGKLIELAGLKGVKIGGARISQKHANYIINTGNAKFKDVKKLIDIISKKVKDEFSIELEPEVRIWR